LADKTNTKEMKLDKNILIGILTSVSVFLIFGGVTALIKNPFFKRMTIPSFLDYFFLIIVSILIGVYVGLYFHNKNKKGNICAYSGGFFGFFAIICPLCSILLIALFGASALIMYFEPIRPVLGFVAIILLLIGIYFQVKIK